MKFPEIAHLKRRLSLRTNWNHWRGLRPILGFRGAAEYIIQNKFNSNGAALFHLHARSLRHPLYARRGSSDTRVFRQIFILREYACLADARDVRLVVDCGANVGYSSAYFLNQFPNCQVIAIEPDPNNFSILRLNGERYGKRFTALHAAVWSESVNLVLSEVPYGDGREWSRQVRPCRPTERSDFNGVKIDAILAASGHERISILKIDVEGAEAVIFAEGHEAWLDKVDSIVIELHDDTVFGRASDIFFEAINSQGFNITRSGELTMCRRSF